MCEDVSRRLFIKAAMAGTAASLLMESRPAGQSQSGSLTDLNLSDASELVRRRKVSPVELTKACLARIEQLNPTLNAFITITAESARAEARNAEAEIQRGKWRGPLHGIPIALKDLFDTAGVRTTAASALFKDRIPKDDAEVVRRLKSAGAVLLGKTNMHEFAFGGTSVVTHFGAVHNPWDLDRIAGGSSGGSAVAVAAGLCYGALGSDTAGSVRQPSAFCGIVGLKPTSCLSGCFSRPQYVAIRCPPDPRRRGSVDTRSACGQRPARGVSGRRPSVAGAGCVEIRIRRDRPEAVPC